MENSRITEYVRNNPNVNRINLVSGFTSAVTTLFERQNLQLWDVANGLHYLHSRNVIHGDLKGVSHPICHSRFSWSQILISVNSKANILIDKDGHARLTDFGLASITRGEYSIFSPQESSAENTATWAAPEVLRGSPATKEGDVFTFAMVAVEVRTRGVSNGSFSTYLPSTRRSQGVPLSLATSIPVYLI